MATIFISVGSNQNAEQQVRFGLEQMTIAFTNLTISKVYESEAVGFEGENFLNLVAKAETQLTIRQVDACFKAIEKAAGRRRDVPKYSDRPLDIDLLLYDDLVCAKPVRLPRGEIEHHAFVLLPLSELAPEDKHPITGESYTAMWRQFPHKDTQKLWPISFEWNL